MADYAIAVFVVMALAVLSMKREIITSMMIVAATWGAWCLFIMATENYEPWQLGIAIDGAAAWYLLRHPSSRPKSVLAAIFCVQVAMHIAYGTVLLTAGAADWQAYYAQTSMTSWAQLLVVGGWAGGHLLRRIVPVRRRVPLLGHRSDSRDMGGEL